MPLLEFEANLETIVQQARQVARVVVVMTPPPVHGPSRLAYQKRKYGARATGVEERSRVAGRYGDVAARVAGRHGCACWMCTAHAAGGGLAAVRRRRTEEAWPTCRAASASSRRSCWRCCRARARPGRAGLRRAVGLGQRTNRRVVARAARHPQRLQANSGVLGLDRGARPLPGTGSRTRAAAARGRVFAGRRVRRGSPALAGRGACGSELSTACAPGRRREASKRLGTGLLPQPATAGRTSGRLVARRPSSTKASNVTQKLSKVGLARHVHLAPVEPRRRQLRVEGAVLEPP